MNNAPNNITPPTAPTAPTPAELAVVADTYAALDRLAALDRAAARPALEERILAVSRRALVPLPRDIAPIGAQVDSLAAADQLAPSSSLEDHAFELSREAVASGRFTDPAPASIDSPPLRIHAHAPVVTRRWWSSSSFRIAAAVALMGAIAALMLRSNPTTTTTPHLAASTPTADEIAANISTEMDLVFATIDTDYTAVITEDTESGSDVDTSWVDELFTRESL